MVNRHVLSLSDLSITLKHSGRHMTLSRLVALSISSRQHLDSEAIKFYEGCSNINASSFITFFPYMLWQNGKRFYKGLYVTFKLAPDLKKNTVYISSYSPLNKGSVGILTNSVLRTYTSDVDVRIILRSTGENSWIFKEVSPYSYIIILWKLRKSDMLLLNYNESLSLKSPYVCK